MRNGRYSTVLRVVIVGVAVLPEEAVFVQDGLRVAVHILFPHYGRQSKFDLKLYYSTKTSNWLMSLLKNSALPNRAKNEAIGFLSKESVVLRHERMIKLSFVDLTPYIHEEFGFIDPDFPHVFSSINENEVPSEGIEWLPAEEVHPSPNYSELITNLQSSLFVKKAISHALIVINWFANNAFSDIFLAELSPHRLYQFDVMVDGVFVHMPIDSYVPVNSTNRKELFSHNYKGSIFPCIYEKLLAKVYGDYESITSEFMDIIELQTFYCRQEVALTAPYNEKDILALIQKKLQEKSIVSFRTRNSIRLQSFGLQSNHVYIILRVVQHQENSLIEFLELQGESWIGRHSKLRSSWLFEEEFIEHKQIIRGQEYKENYMSLSDMQGIGRQLIVLNNTQQYHKNYYASHSPPSCFNLFRFVLQQTNKCMMRVNFKHKKCYGALYIIQKQQKSYTLKKTTFSENKDSLFMELGLEAGEYFAVVYNAHSQQQALPFNFTLFTSQQFVQIQPISSNNEMLLILEQTFLNYFIQHYKSAKDSLVFKQMYATTGLAFVFVHFQNELTININNSLLEERKIYCVNVKPIDTQFALSVPSGQPNIIIFRCLWSKKENIDFQQEHINSKEEVDKIVFPPQGSLKVFQKFNK